MAIETRTSSRSVRTRLLDASDLPLAWRFLQRSGIRDVYLASQVWGGALSHRTPSGGPDFLGAFENGILRAILYLGNGGLAVPAGSDPEAIAALGETLGRRALELRALIGEDSSIEILASFVREAGARVRLDVGEDFLELDAERIDRSAREPTLRPANLRDLEMVARASSRAHHEEMGEDPLATNPTAFTGRVARQILDGRVFVIREGDELVFKAEYSASCPTGAQISGVFTAPAYRGQGFARRGTGELAHRALDQCPTVCLFVRRDNEPARRAYERVGFRHTADFRTMFFENARPPDRL